MVDDGSGASGFVLENVALGRNKFEAYAESYQQDLLKSIYGYEDQADTPWEWIDAQRGRHPNVNFYDNDNALKLFMKIQLLVKTLVNLTCKLSLDV